VLNTVIFFPSFVLAFVGVRPLPKMHLRRGAQQDEGFSRGAHHHGPSPLVEERRTGRGMEMVLRIALQATEGMTI
jgi:hypothetical protein